MLAHLCWMAWKLPIGRPNCSRTLAYSTDISRTFCARARGPRLERDALRVQARAGLELRQRDAQLARRELREELLLLRRAAAREEGHAAQDHRREERAGQHDAAHLLEDDGQIDEVEARATVLLGEDEAHPAERSHLLPGLVAEAPLILHH